MRTLGVVPALRLLNVSLSVCQPYCLCVQTLIFSIIVLGKLIQTNSGAREHLFYEAPSGNRKTISVPDVERLQWSTFTCVLGPTVKGVFPPGSDVTDVNATSCCRDGTLLASGDDFGLVKLFEYPVSVSFPNFRQFQIHLLLHTLRAKSPLSFFVEGVKKIRLF